MSNWLFSFLSFVQLIFLLPGGLSFFTTRLLSPCLALDQGCQTYGPRAKTGPLRGWIGPAGWFCKLKSSLFAWDDFNYLKPSAIAYILLFSTVFSSESFPFSAYFLLHLHTGFNFQTGIYEHAKVQLLLIKFSTRTPGENIPWDPVMSISKPSEF